MTRAGYDYWMFDLDGTLVDVEDAYIRTHFDRVGRRLDRSFSDAEARALWYGIGGDRETILAEIGVDRDAFWHAFDAVERPAARIAATSVYDDALPVLDAIEGPTGLVTHCQPRLTHPILAELGLRDRFDAVVCCSDDIGWKPDPAPVTRAMADLGVSDRDHGVLIGDGPCDVGAARNAGLECIHIDRHGHRDRAANSADWAVDRLDSRPITSGLEAG